MPEHIADTCQEEHGPSGARCYKRPGHDGPHNAFSHYPGQIVTWESGRGCPGGDA